ncbi:response regulator receiver [Nitrosococcus halophilus Nc 4]|uniref:Response regulator receiver n=1 Tax=Nitrosococcus halophilus (strain Nc4) TaxID=472759 RepID=D5C1Q7_NITHN|nr:response regulator [Nitrosococcus halophilus]ADE14690.1 response regulator receiver [Nitrosococcus halophilus Nc 4]
MMEETVFIVDDDASIRRSLERLIKSVGFQVESFASAQEFLRREPTIRPAGLVLDVRMPGPSGFDLQDKLAFLHCNLPIIFITGHGTIPLSVRAMKGGAIEFLTKPLDEQYLLDAIHKAVELNRQAMQEQVKITEVQQRLTSLTPRESEVFKLVITGLLNKQIAFKLGRSEKTIKVHRARVMEKMQAKSLAQLVRLAEKMGIQSSED